MDEKFDEVKHKTFTLGYVLYYKIILVCSLWIFSIDMCCIFHVYSKLADMCFSEYVLMYPVKLGSLTVNKWSRKG